MLTVLIACYTVREINKLSDLREVVRQAKRSFEAEQVETAREGDTPSNTRIELNEIDAISL